MSDSDSTKSVSDRFNAFHLQVAVINDRLAWVVDKMDIEDPAVSILYGMHEELERLIEEQDCREDIPLVAKLAT